MAKKKPKKVKKRVKRSPEELKALQEKALQLHKKEGLTLQATADKLGVGKHDVNNWMRSRREKAEQERIQKEGLLQASEINKLSKERGHKIKEALGQFATHAVISLIRMAQDIEKTPTKAKAGGLTLKEKVAIKQQSIQSMNQLIEIFSKIGIEGFENIGKNGGVQVNVQSIQKEAYKAGEALFRPHDDIRIDVIDGQIIAEKPAGNRKLIESLELDASEDVQYQHDIDENPSESPEKDVEN